MADSPSISWEPPSPEDLQRMLPQYEIFGLIGRGGMGVVYRGRQIRLGRDVAIKVLPEALNQAGDDLNFAARFEQEARAMAALSHPGIVTVHDFGETSEGHLYFVMEYIDGMDIHQYIHSQGGRLPQKYALSIAANVLDALAYAHGHGVAHRDIKPANILLDYEGRVKISDFGLAKRFGGEGDRKGDSAPAMTLTGMALGTPDYAPPEVFDSTKTPDHRADLYAVGVMLYQMLTGRLPRGNWNFPSEIRPELDPRLDEIVSRALQPEPDDRYPMATAFRLALDPVITSPMTRVDTPRRKKSNTPLALRISIAAAVLVLGGLVAFLIADLAKESRKAPVTVVVASEAAPASLPEESEMAAPAENLGAPASSPAEKPEQPADPPKAAGPTTIAVAATKNETPPAKVAVAAEPVPVPADSRKMPEPAATVAQAAASNPPRSGEAPEPPSAAVAKPSLPAIPGLKQRVEGFLQARREQVGDLAGKYRKALETRFNQAADAGDLVLAGAFEEEKKRIEALEKALAGPPSEALAAMNQEVALPELPEGTPPALAALRQTWTTEREKIQAQLDQALQQSLKALESDLTRSRELAQAREVLAFRESLAPTPDPALALVPVPATGAPAPTLDPVPPTGASASLAAATKDKPFENSLGMKFVPVPGTDVLFCIHETRWRDYAAYAKKNPDIAANWQSQTFDGFKPAERPEDHPVVNVSWEEAKAFCEWLSKEEGRTYRLPKDQDWTVAVGLGRKEKWGRGDTLESVIKDQSEFPWGRDWPPPPRVGNYSDQSRKAKAPRADVKYLEDYDDGFPTTAPVMSFAPNEHGLYDLSGNVWEWCEDWWNSANEQRVLRGGSWINYEPGALLSSGRGHAAPTFRLYSRGFRVVVVVSSSAP